MRRLVVRPLVVRRLERRADLGGQTSRLRQRPSGRREASFARRRAWHTKGALSLQTSSNGETLMVPKSRFWAPEVQGLPLGGEWKRVGARLGGGEAVYFLAWRSCVWEKFGEQHLTHLLLAGCSCCNGSLCAGAVWRSFCAPVEWRVQLSRPQTVLRFGWTRLLGSGRPQTVCAGRAALGTEPARECHRWASCGPDINVAGQTQEAIQLASLRRVIFFQFALVGNGKRNGANWSMLPPVVGFRQFQRVCVF